MGKRAGERVRRMTTAEFLRRDAGQDDGPRHELVDGVPVATSPERARHALVKIDTVIALREGIRRAELDCTAFGDGMTVVVDEANAYEPDAVVQCGDWQEDDVTLASPVVVVEVLSPSTGSLDASGKLAGYLSLPSVAHYLIVDAAHRAVIHHVPGEEPDTIATRVVHAGELSLAPPGIVLDVGACFASLPPR